MDHRALHRLLVDLLADQDGVVGRRQLLEAGAADHDIARLRRHRDLAPVHPGVYVDHTGPLSWAQRAWAAVLYAAPAALFLESATASPRPDAVVHVAIDSARRVRQRPGLRVHRVRGLSALVRWSASPPRVRVEENTLELAHRARSELDVVAVLTGAVGGRETTADRLVAALGRRPRMARRRFVVRVLADLAEGVQSVLEHRFLTRVVRAHGLPACRWQSPRRGRRGREYRDAEFGPFGVVVELDGEGNHGSWAAGERDAERDLADAAAGMVTVRLRWGQVVDRPCHTAGQLAAVLTARGWTGRPHPCGSGCRLADAA